MGPLGVVIDAVCWLYWLLAAGAVTTVLLWPNAAPAFRDAVVLSACRGKLWEGRPPARLGPLTAASVPQSWFLHFYLVAVAANITLLVLAWQLHLQQVVLAAMLLLQLHFTRRLLETAYLMRYPAGARMHMLAYLFGLSYYVVLPASLAGGALISSAMAKQPAAGHVQAVHRPWPLYLGAAVLLGGNVLQWHSHKLLAGLKRQAGKPGSPEAYAIPHGGAFELVSCPHYAAEIVIYAGLAVFAAKQRPVLLLVLAWVAGNLLLAAQITHQWYQHKFDTYPSHRRALVPWLI